MSLQEKVMLLHQAMLLGHFESHSAWNNDLIERVRYYQEEFGVEVPSEVIENIGQADHYLLQAYLIFHRSVDKAVKESENNSS